MSKFQYNDKVICVKNTPEVTEGWVGWISANRTEGYPYFAVINESGEYAFREDELELLERAKKEEHPEDKVNKPNHYQLKGDFEVKHLMELLLDRIEESDKIQFSHFQSSCYKEMMQYLLRCMLKNGYEDIYKARYYLNEVIRVHEERMRS